MSDGKGDLRIGGGVGGSVNTGRVGGSVTANEKDQPNNTPAKIIGAVVVVALLVLAGLFFYDKIDAIDVSTDGVKVNTE